jgi:hypothetical protein
VKIQGGGQSEARRNAEGAHRAASAVSIDTFLKKTRDSGKRKRRSLRMGPFTSQRIPSLTAATRIRRPTPWQEAAADRQGGDDGMSGYKCGRRSNAPLRCVRVAPTSSCGSRPDLRVGDGHGYRNRSIIEGSPSTASTQNARFLPCSLRLPLQGAAETALALCAPFHYACFRTERVVH